MSDRYDCCGAEIGTSHDTECDPSAEDLSMSGHHPWPPPSKESMEKARQIVDTYEIPARHTLGDLTHEIARALDEAAEAARNEPANLGRCDATMTWRDWVAHYQRENERLRQQTVTQAKAWEAVVDDWRERMAELEQERRALIVAAEANIERLNALEARLAARESDPYADEGIPLG